MWPFDVSRCQATNNNNANAQGGSSRKVESHSHDGVTLRSGRRIQHESTVARRQVTSSLDGNHDNHYHQDVTHKLDTKEIANDFITARLICMSVFGKF